MLILVWLLLFSKSAPYLQVAGSYNRAYASLWNRCRRELIVKDKMADFWWIFNIQCLIIIDNKKIRKIMINPYSMIHQYTFLKYYILYLAYAAIIS